MRRRLAGLIVVALVGQGCRLILGIGDAAEAPGLAEGGLGDASARTDAADAATFVPPCEGWCWENPLPQGGELLGAWASSPTDIWAVGRNGATVHFDGRAFEVRTNTRLELRRVWAASDAEAFALGDPGSGLAVVRFDAGTWGESLRATSPGTLQLMDLWGSGQDVWAVGGAATPPQPSAAALHLAPGSSSWEDVGSPWDASTGPPTLQSIRGTGPTDVWAMSSGRLARWRGSWQSGSCESFGVPSCNSQVGLLAEGPGPSSVLWLLGQSGSDLTFSRFDGSWNVVATKPYVGGVAAAAATKTEVWILGQTTPMAASRLRGTELSAPIPLPDNVTYNALAPYGDHEVIAVGMHGAIARLEGDAWKRWPGTGGVYSNLADICVSEGTAIAVGVGTTGSNAVVLRKRDGLFAETSFGNEIGATQSCWLAGANEQWLLAGDILRSDGKSFETIFDAPPGVTLRQVRGDAATRTVWAVGIEMTEGGTGTRAYAARFDGKTFVPDSPTEGQELRALWLDPATQEVWAVGSGSLVVRHDKTGWRRVDPSPSPVVQLLSVGGSSASDVWVAGQDLVAHWNGSEWETRTPATPVGQGSVTWSALAVHGDRAWALGPNVSPRQWDGHTWVDLPGAPNLTALAFDRDGALWAAGAEGAIVRHGP